MEFAKSRFSWFYAKVRWAVMLEGRGIREWKEAGILFRSTDLDSAFGERWKSERDTRVELEARPSSPIGCRWSRGS